VKFSEDVLQTSRKRSHIGCYGETEPDGVAGGGVRVLTDDQDMDVVKGLLKGAQDVRTGWCPGTSGG